MKKTFKIIGICCLTCFSFYYTNEIIKFSRQKDPLMVEILEQQEIYNVEAVNAEVNGDYIIAGASGNIIDVDKSYQKMKKLGEFNENLLVFINDLPNKKTKDNLDKYIISSKTNKDYVSLIFILKDDSNINEILNILQKNNIKTTFFLDGNLIENNYINEITKKGHNLGITGYNNNYELNKIKYVSDLIKQYNKEIYCYTNNKNIELLDSCSKLKLNTILSSKVEKQLYYYLKSNLNKGSIYAITNSDNNIENLDISIKYIKQKGYSIVNIDELLD